MNVQLIGYVRCSTKEQNPDRQIIAMKKFGVPEDAIVVEAMSGKDFNRPKYEKIIQGLKPGKALVLDALDRLGRNYDEIISQWRYITKDLGADIVLLDMPLLDTRKKDRDLTASFVADLVLQILSYVSEKERELNRQRQEAGIAAAKAKGVRFGRKPLEHPEMLGMVREQWERGEISSREAGHILGVSHTTFLAWVKEKSGE